MAASPVVIAATAKHTATLIFLHGLGDTGHGWASGMGSIRPPHVKVICPTAPTMPVTLNGGFRMPSWFDLRTLDANGPEDEEGIRRASELVHAMIDQEVKGGIPSNRIVLGGFSQGGALAMYSALTCSKSLAGVIALSCWLPLHKQFPAIQLWPAQVDGAAATPKANNEGATAPKPKEAESKAKAEAEGAAGASSAGTETDGETTPHDDDKGGGGGSSSVSTAQDKGATAPSDDGGTAKDNVVGEGGKERRSRSVSVRRRGGESVDRGRRSDSIAGRLLGRRSVGSTSDRGGGKTKSSGKEAKGKTLAAINNQDIPFLQCHGDCDPIVPYKWGQMTASLLKQFLKHFEFKTYRGMMHSSSDEEILDLKAFLEKALPPE